MRGRLPSGVQAYSYPFPWEPGDEKYVKTLVNRNAIE